MPSGQAAGWLAGLGAAVLAFAPPALGQAPAAEAGAAVAACAPLLPPRRETEASARQIQAFVRQRQARVLTFEGYSGAGYEDPAAMLALARQVLAAQDPRTTWINIGATAEGVGAVYALARQAGFNTLGIVSTLARDEGVPLSDCVQFVFFVRDVRWGGRLPGRQRLSPASAAIVAISDEMVGIGGGEIARDEMLAARRAGKPLRFYPADMNHALARDKAARKGQPAPDDFRGAAAAVLAAPAAAR
jgi:hypothetical protein